MSRQPHRVLVVAPHFAPTNAPDGQRIRLCLPYLRDFGWEAEILAADPAVCQAPLDPFLGTDEEAGVPIHRHGALPAAFCRRFGIGNIALRSRWHRRQMAECLLRTGRFDLVFYSTTQWAALSEAPAWKRRFKLPYAVDLQDPWVTDFYERPGAPPPPGGWKYRFSKFLAKQQEARILGRADGLVSVSPRFLAELKQRVPRTRGLPSVTLPFGASPLDLQRALELGQSGRFGPSLFQRDQVNLVAIGALGGLMQPALRRLFESLADLRRSAPEHASRLRIHLIGTSYADTAPLAGTTPEALLAAQIGIADLLVEHPARIPFHQALWLMNQAEATLVFGSTEAGYVPSKIAQVCLAAKRVVCLSPRSGQAFHACRDAGFQACFDTESAEDGGLATQLLHLAQGDIPERKDQRSLPPHLDARETSAKLCHFLDLLLGHP